MLKFQITNSKSQTNYNTKCSKLQAKPLIFGIVILVFGIVCNLCIVYWNLNYAYAESSSKEEDTLFMAKKAFEDGFYDASLGLLERFLKNYPDSPKTIEANLLAGECYFYQNKLSEALTKFEELLQESQAKSIKDSLYYWIGEVNFKRNDFTQARAYYKDIIEEFPGSSYAPIAYYSLGWCLFQEQKFQEALEYFKALAVKFPKEPQSKDALFKIVECLYNLKDYTAVKEKIGLSIPAFSKDTLRLSYLYFYLGEADYYLGNYSGSLEAYAKVLANNPDDKMQALAKLDLGWSYLKLKRYQEAEDIFVDLKQEYLEKRSRDILLLGRAMLLTETNRLNQAKELYGRLISEASDPVILAQGYIGRADALYNLADYPEASRAYREALARINLKSMPAQLVDKLNYNLSCSLLKQGEFKEAVNGFQKVFDNSSDLNLKLSSLCQIGDAYQEYADYQKSAQVYSRLLKEYPDSSYTDYALYQLSASYLKDSQNEEAILNLSGFGKKFPSSRFLDDATYTLGLAYFRKQDYTSAKAVLNKFQGELKNSDLRPKALYLLGSCLYSLGDYSAAIQVFKEIPRSSRLDADLAQKAEYAAADSLYQMGQEQEALGRFKALRSKYSDSKLAPDIAWWLGNYYYQHNEPELAARYFLSIIQDFSGSDLLAEAYYGLGLTLLDGAKAEEALDNFKKALSLNKPGIKPKVIIDIAELYFKAGDYTNAMDYYKKALEFAPRLEISGIHLKIAEIQESRNRFDDAIKEYLEVIKLSDPKDALAVKALLRLAQIYEDQANYKEALNTYSKILSMGISESKYAEEQITRLKGPVK